MICRIVYEKQIKADPFYCIDGLDDLKVQLQRQYGNPFKYKNDQIQGYYTLPYGKPVVILQEPQLQSMAPTKYLTMMLSRSCDYLTREIVRNNTHNGSLYHIVFILATAYPNCNEAIAKENAKHQDMLQFSHMDSFSNITLTVLFSFHYISKKHLPVKYVIKTDSDCVVNYDELERRMNGWRQEPLYTGYVGRGHHFKTGTRSRNAVPAELVGSNPVLPPYAYGGGYVIRYDVIPKMLLGIRHLPFITHNEDVNIGRGMSVVNISAVSSNHRWMVNGCKSKEDCLRFVIMHHGHDDSGIARYYSYLSSCCVLLTTVL